MKVGYSDPNGDPYGLDSWYLQQCGSPSLLWDAEPSCAPMNSPLYLPDYVTSITSTALHLWMHQPPWEITANAASIVHSLLDQTDLQDYVVTDEVAVHRSVVVKPAP
eukprot:gene22026-42236_t